MTGEPQHAPTFDADLYRGTAEAYDRFRPGYPKPLTEDLLGRVRPSGRGRLLDLACGTGQLAFALGQAFAEVWAVDREPDMIDVVESRTTELAGRLRTVVSDAEVLDAPAGTFELVVIGTAFHRLERPVVAARSFHWLESGGHVALCWADAPWEGPAEWQQVLDDALRRWRERLGAGSRTPPDWEVARRRQPDAQVMGKAGFVGLGRFSFPGDRRWTVPDLVGFVHSTSFLPTSVLGEHATAFAADLADRLHPYSRNGELDQQVSYAYDLFRRP